VALRSPEEASPFSHAARQLIAGIEIEAASKGTLFAGTRELLAELGRRSIRIGVVTRNCRAAVCATFPDIDRYCQAVLTRDDTERIKPHPKHLTTALGLLATLPADAAMVGDHPLDIQLGRGAGTFTIGVLSGHSTREALCGAGADLILPAAYALLKNLP
jgi:phosphoglycolate phosphatase